MSRIEKLKKSVDDLYTSKKEGRAEWADWLHAHHVFLVAERAGFLADRYGANKELTMAAGILHDIADAVMSRFDSKHAQESEKIAKDLLRQAGFSDAEIHIVVDDAIRSHGCHGGTSPMSLEGKIMATADAFVHLKTDFYEHAVQVMEGKKTNDEIKKWALPKIERDFQNKILFEDIREEARSAYEKHKQFFSGL